MNDLPGGMHAGIRTARAGYVDVFVSDERQRLFEALLHTESGFLALPTVVRRAVVFDAERNAHGFWVGR